MTPSESRALMRRELDEQPAILSGAADALAEAGARLRPDPARPIWIGGCGDSLFAAQALALHYRRLGWDIRPASAAEILWDTPIRRGDTVVGLSISGSTRRTVEALAAASATGANTLAVTLNPDSALAQAASGVLVLPYQPVSRAIPHGLDYHITLLALAALAGQIDGAAVGLAMRSATPASRARAEAIAAGLSPDARVMFLGGGSAMGTANYGAAKLHEAGGLPALSCEAENFAHGAHFMLRPGDHVVLCHAGGPSDARTDAMKSGLLRLGVSVGSAGSAAEGDTLIAAMTAALDAQTLCLAIAETQDLDVSDPGRGSAAADVQREWFGWKSA